MATTTGRPQRIYDNASILEFGRQDNAMGWPKNDLLLTDDTDVLALCAVVLRQQKRDFIGISDFDFDADMDTVHLYGKMVHMAATGIGNSAVCTVHWCHPNGNNFAHIVRMIGVHGSISFPDGETSHAKFTGTIRCVKDTPGMP